MAIKIDTSKSVQDNLLNLLLESYPTSNFSLSKISFGIVTPLTGDPSGKNSQLTITAIKNLGFSGTSLFKFNRLTVSQGVPAGALPNAISINPADTQIQRQQKVAAALGLILSEVTITGVGGGTIGTPANEDDTSVSVVVTPNGNSSLYQGNPLTIQLTTPDTDVPLSSIITNTVMNGFDPA